MLVKINCPFCLEIFSIHVFIEDGKKQEITYDCEICCHPIDLKIYFNSNEECQIQAERADGF